MKAIAEANNFLFFYEGGESVKEVNLIKADSYYRQIDYSTRDTIFAEEALKLFEKIISDFDDIKNINLIFQKIVYLKKIMICKKIIIGKIYIDRKEYIAATINFQRAFLMLKPLDLFFADNKICDVQFGKMKRTILCNLTKCYKLFGLGNEMKNFSTIKNEG